MREELAVLEHQREAPPVGRHPREVAAVEGDRALGHRLQPRHRPQQRRLAAARRSEHGEHPPLLEVEGDSVDGTDVAVPHDHVTQGERHQNAVTGGTRSRSTASTTSAVVAARSTDAASAIP